VLGIAVDKGRNIFATDCEKFVNCAIEKFDTKHDSPVEMINFPAQPENLPLSAGRVPFDSSGNLFASLGVRGVFGWTFYIFGFGQDPFCKIPNMQITEQTALRDFAIY
jgi:hypothetical protein